MGHTLKDIHQRLVEDGIEVSYTVFLSYISRIRRERSHSPFVQNRHLTVPVAAAKAPPVREDPLASAMRALSKPRYDIREAMCDGDPTKQKLF
jgi:hypothetical protein